MAHYVLISFHFHSFFTHRMFFKIQLSCYLCSSSLSLTAYVALRGGHQPNLFTGVYQKLLKVEGVNLHSHSVSKWSPKLYVQAPHFFKRI